MSKVFEMQTLDALYAEISQFTKVKTAREMRWASLMSEAAIQLRLLGEKNKHIYGD